MSQKRHTEHGPLAASPSALFLANAGGRVVAVGGAWDTLTGVPERDALGVPLASFVPLEGLTYGRISPSGAGAALLTGAGDAGRRVRVSWRRESGWLAGSIEPLGAPAESCAAPGSLPRALRRPPGERDHVERVAGYAARLGRALKLGEESLRALNWAAHLHDVGKAQVPDHILLKPSPLTESERDVMREHPALGETMLAQLAFLPDQVRELVLSHHERWDGLGYPRGLHGHQIPLLARALSIADVFDALTSARSYKPAWSEHHAAEYLLRGAARQFDPDLVTVFVRDVLHLELG